MDELIAVLEETNRLLSQYFSRNMLEIISIIISSAALVFAVLVPVRIADKQNKIALFEKRFTAYSDLLKVKSFADMMRQDECSFQVKDIIAAGKDPERETYRRCEEVLLNFQTFFYGGEERPRAVNVGRVTLSTIRSLELSIHALPMLYSKELPNNGNDASKEVTEIFESFAALMNAVITPILPFDDRCRTNFVLSAEIFFNKYADIFEAGIRL